MLDLVQFALDEVKRQRRRYKQVAVACGWSENRLYDWQERGKPGELKRIPVADIQRVLAVLGYDLVPLPIERIDDE